MARVIRKESGRPRNRPSVGVGPKVPLTKYYRSGNQAPAGVDSPFGAAEPVAKRIASRTLLSRILDYVIVIVIVFCVIYSFVVNPEAKVIASSTAYRPVTAYKAAAADELGSLKNRNKATLDESTIEASLKKRFPEINSVTVELPLVGQTPTVHLSISEPTFFLTSQGQAYIIDSEGRAAGSAHSLPNIKNLPVIADQSGFDVKEGRPVLSITSVNFIKTLLTELNRAKVPIQSLTLPPLPSELDLRTSDQPYYVKFFLGGDVLGQAGEYLAARHNFEQSGNDTPSQYLDVRVSGKIFYK